MKCTNSTSRLSKNIADSNATIVVTGATGWVGKTVLHVLQTYLTPSEFQSRVIAFASKEQIISSSAYSAAEAISIPILPLSHLPLIAHSKELAIVHTAFLTKDRIATYGYQNFITTNMMITSLVEAALETASASRVVSVSSGAALIAKTRQEKSIKLSDDPYGILKLKEEELLNHLSTVAVFRIFALSGRFIRNPSSFALGDFLNQALNGNQIEIHSRYPVIRGYVNASDVALAALMWLFSDCPPLVISAVSEIVALASLAKRVSELFGLPLPLVSPLYGNPNSYTDSPIKFYKLCSDFGFQPLDLDGQIQDTAKGILGYAEKPSHPCDKRDD